jgi:hypothetical protein
MLVLNVLCDYYSPVKWHTLRNKEFPLLKPVSEIDERFKKSFYGYAMSLTKTSE